MTDMHCLIVEDQRILLDLLGSMVKSFSEINTISKADSLNSAKEYSKSNCIHFVQDKRLDKLMMTPKDIKHRLSKWKDVEKLILENLFKNEKREIQ